MPSSVHICMTCACANTSVISLVLVHAGPHAPAAPCGGCYVVYDDVTARVARGGELPSDARAAPRGEAAVRLRDLESDSATSSALPSPPPSSAKAAPAFSPTAW